MKDRDDKAGCKRGGGGRSVVGCGWRNGMTSPTDGVLGFPESNDGNGRPRFSGMERRPVEPDPLTQKGRGEI
jgi:hypothetical protein